MSIFQAFILGIVQGITEFLPISSSGHLIIIPELLGWLPSPLVFDTSLHLGTTLAVVVYFYRDLIKATPKMIKNLAFGTIPVMVIGFLFGDRIEILFRTGLWVSIFLAIGSFLMHASQNYSRKIKKESVKEKDLGLKQSFIIGIFQAIALLPGISRSGSTISGGLFFGLSKEEAAKFSFLLSTPAVLLVAGYKLATTFGDIAAIGYAPWVVGMITSFLVGIVSINFLLTFLKKSSLNAFIIYRLVLAVLLLIVL